MNVLSTTQAVGGTMTDEQIDKWAVKHCVLTRGVEATREAARDLFAIAASEASAEPVAWINTDANYCTNDAVVAKCVDHLIPVYSAPEKAVLFDACMVREINPSGAPKEVLDRIINWEVAVNTAADYAALHLTPEQAAKEAK